MCSSGSSQASVKGKGKGNRRPPWIESLYYKCGFCREVLRKARISGIWWLLVPVGFRRFYCPHCFEMRIRPCGWLRLVLAPLWMLRNLTRL